MADLDRRPASSVLPPLALPSKTPSKRPSRTTYTARGTAQDDELKTEDDLIKLSDLTETEILETLKARHAKGIVYTYIADIVISVNPFQQNTYKRGKETCMLYLRINEENKKDDENKPPHVYALMDNVYAKLRKEPSKGQSVLISGESGAGKTETTKVCLEFLRHATPNQGSTDVASFMSANPVIEAIGNAKTVRNDNSSRFGKHLDVQLDAISGRILGAKTQAYLLEKPRVCTHLVGRYPS
jgi:myosin heavy subunit